MSKSLSGPRHWLTVALGLLLVGTVLLVAACDLAPATPTAVSGASTGTPASSAPTAIVTDVINAPPAAPSVMTLTMWVTEAFSPTEAITSGQILAREAAAFQAAHPDVRLEFVLKKPYGKGGILDYLLTTSSVVPELLPDLSIIDAEELPTAVQAQVVQPVDDLLSPDLVNDLYPFARALNSFDGQLMGLLYRADLDHMIYNTGKLTVPPRSWPGVLSDPGTYIFAAGGQSGLVNDSFLMQYLAVHPWSADAGESFLEESSLIAVLQFYQDGVTQGVFPLDILDYHTTEECWSAYVAAEADLTHASAHRYLVDGQDLPSSAVAPIPAINGAASAIGRGWALVLVTNEPNRQALAAEFMVQLLAPATNAAWNRAVGYLPTRQSALANAAEDDSYARFIHQQLMTAQIRPRLPNYAQVAAALQEAVEAVITGAATPEEAAQNVVGGGE